MRAEELHFLRFDQAKLHQLVECLLDLDDQRTAGHRADDVVGQAPSELLGDFEADGLRSFSIVRTQVDVDEAPAMLVGDLRAETVDLIVVAGDAHDLRAEHVGPENLCGLEIGGDEDPGLQSFARGVCGDGVGQVSGRRTRDGVEAEGFRLRQRDGDDAVFEAQRGQADGVVLEIEIARGACRFQSTASRGVEPGTVE